VCGEHSACARRSCLAVNKSVLRYVPLAELRALESNFGQICAAIKVGKCVNAVLTQGLHDIRAGCTRASQYIVAKVYTSAMQSRLLIFVTLRAD
jgi:hypothetical protein